MASLSAKKPFSGLLRKSIQTPPETAQCNRQNYRPLNLTALFRANLECLILFEKATVATFLHRRSLHCRSNYHSCTGGHFPAEATTSPAPATFLQQRLPVLQQQLPVLHQRSPSCTSRYQQLQILNQRPLSCTSRYQSYTSDYLSNECQSCTSYPDLLQRLDPAPTITIRPRRLFAIRFSDCNSP